MRITRSRCREGWAKSQQYETVEKINNAKAVQMFETYKGKLHVQLFYLGILLVFM